MQSFRGFFPVRALAVLLAAGGCLTLLSGGLLLSGCGEEAPKEDAQKADAFQMQVSQVDQYTRLADKTADGQFLVIKTDIKNNGNETIVPTPDNFVLQNITDNEKERYSQPAERFITPQFAKVYGEEVKEKIMDFNPVNLYPRLQVERYFVFMVPAEAKADQYQITYTPGNVSAPLVSTSTVVNDHRNDVPAQSP